MRGGAAALLLLSAPALLAQPGLEQRAYLELFVNDVSKDTVLVYLRGADAPDDALVAVTDLENGGVGWGRLSLYTITPAPAGRRSSSPIGPRA